MENVYSCPHLGNGSSGRVGFREHHEMDEEMQCRDEGLRGDRGEGLADHQGTIPLQTRLKQLPTNSHSRMYQNLLLKMRWGKC